MKILIMHGPNLDMLGKREPEVYGHDTLESINESVLSTAAKSGVEAECFQSNEEGTLVSKLWEAANEFDGVIFNPAAYTHTSVALHDAIKGCGLPCVEVHLSNTHKRESFRHNSVTASACLGQVMGFGAAGYRLALKGLVDYLKGSQE